MRLKKNIYFTNNSYLNIYLNFNFYSNKHLPVVYL